MRKNAFQLDQKLSNSRNKDTDFFLFFQDTVYGKCDSKVEFKSRRGNVAEDISINRDLKACENFSPIRDYVSPIAIVKGLVSVPLKTMQ